MIFTGYPTPGKGRGRKIGFPTINLNKINTMAMENGVYAAWATLDGKKYRAALFIGTPLTFKDAEQSVELHLIGDQLIFSELPSHIVRVQTVEFIRPIQKFASPNNLVKQIQDDIHKISTILERHDDSE